MTKLVILLSLVPSLTFASGHCEKILNCEVRDTKSYFFTAKSCHSSDSLEIYTAKGELILQDFDAKMTRVGEGKSAVDFVEAKNADISVFQLPPEPLYMDQTVYSGYFEGYMAGKGVMDLPIDCTYTAF